MAKVRKAPLSAATPRPTAGPATTPDPPPGPLAITKVPLPAGTVLHRVHLKKFDAVKFNPGTAGNARFSPIKNDKGTAIPTLYAAATFEAAAMETVFHDVSFTPGFKSYDKTKLIDQMHSVVKTNEVLTLVDLRTKALRKLGIPRNRLIDTEKDQYPVTRLWAQAIHAQDLDAQGLLWQSRQDDSAQAVMLFGDRIDPAALVQSGGSLDLTTDSTTYLALLTLAEAIGVNVV